MKDDTGRSVEEMEMNDIICKYDTREEPNQPKYAGIRDDVGGESWPWKSQ